MFLVGIAVQFAFLRQVIDQFRIFGLCALAQPVVLILIDQADHDVGIGRIIQGSFSLDEGLPDGTLRKDLTVVLFARHVIIGIGDCDDPCDRRDCFALQLFGISGPVVVLMVVCRARL